MNTGLVMRKGAIWINSERGRGGDNIIYTHAVTNYISTYVYIRDFGGKTMLPQRKMMIIRLLKDYWFVLRRCFSCKCHAALHEKLRIITNSELRSWRRHGVRYFTIMFFVVKSWILATMEDLFPIIYKIPGQNVGPEKTISWLSGNLIGTIASGSNRFFRNNS